MTLLDLAVVLQLVPFVYLYLILLRYCLERRAGDVVLREVGAQGRRDRGPRHDHLRDGGGLRPLATDRVGLDLRGEARWPASRSAWASRRCSIAGERAGSPRSSAPA